MEKIVTVTTRICDACGKQSVTRSFGRRFYVRRRRDRSPWKIREFIRADLCPPCKSSLGKTIQAWRRSRAKVAQKTQRLPR